MVYKLDVQIILEEGVWCIHEMGLDIVSVNPLKHLSNWKEEIYLDNYPIYLAMYTRVPIYK